MGSTGNNKSTSTFLLEGDSKSVLKAIVFSAGLGIAITVLGIGVNISNNTLTASSAYKAIIGLPLLTLLLGASMQLVCVIARAIIAHMTGVYYYHRQGSILGWLIGKYSSESYILSKGFREVEGIKRLDKQNTTLGDMLLANFLFDIMFVLFWMVPWVGIFIFLISLDKVGT